MTYTNTRNYPFVMVDNDNIPRCFCETTDEAIELMNKLISKGFTFTLMTWVEFCKFDNVSLAA